MEEAYLDGGEDSVRDEGSCWPKHDMLARHAYIHLCAET